MSYELLKAIETMYPQEYQLFLDTHLPQGTNKKDNYGYITNRHMLGAYINSDLKRCENNKDIYIDLLPHILAEVVDDKFYSECDESYLFTYKENYLLRLLKEKIASGEYLIKKYVNNEKRVDLSEISLLAYYKEYQRLGENSETNKVFAMLKTFEKDLKQYLDQKKSEALQQLSPEEVGGGTFGIVAYMKKKLQEAFILG